MFQLSDVKCHEALAVLGIMYHCTVLALSCLHTVQSVMGTKKQLIYISCIPLLYILVENFPQISLILFNWPIIENFAFLKSMVGV